MSEPTQPASSKRLLVLCLGGAVMIGAVAIATFGISPGATAAVNLLTFDGPSMTEVQLPPGADVEFAAHAEEASFSKARNESLQLHIELLDGEKVVLAKDCVAIGGPQVRSGGTQTDVTFSSGQCDLTVPDSGANLIQITPAWEHGGAGVKADGLSILVFVD